MEHCKFMGLYNMSTKNYLQWTLQIHFVSNIIFAFTLEKIKEVATNCLFYAQQIFGRLGIYDSLRAALYIQKIY